MAAVQQVHGGDLHAAAKKYGIEEKYLLDFSANINPLGPSKIAVEAIMSNISRINHYPDPNCTELKQALAESINVPVTNLIIGNGAVELIFLLMHLIKPGQALIPAPTFGEYGVAVKAAGGEIKSLPLTKEENFVLKTEAVLEELMGADIVFICNPNNPTGVLTTRDALEGILEKAAQQGKWVIVDEAFMDFVKEKEKYSVIDLVDKYPKLFILYSLTKFHAIPGLRLGAGIGSPDVIERLAAIKDPWNVNAMAQLAGVASLSDSSYMADTIELVQREKETLYYALKEIKGLKPYHPSVNYIFIDVTATGRTSHEITEAMGRRGILIRDCASYPSLGSGYIRVAVKDKQSNIRLVDNLRAVI